MSVLPKTDDTTQFPDDVAQPAADLVVSLDLAARAAAGDRDAFTEIYQQHINRIYGLSLRLTSDRVQAETLAQDTFVKAWTSLGSYAGRGSLSGWLGRLAVNLWRDRFRQQARQERLLQKAALSWEHDRLPGGTVVPLLTALDLERSLARLPEGARTVFVLHEIEGYKHHEIAELLALTTGTVKSQLHRARKLLRVLMDTEQASSQGA